MKLISILLSRSINFSNKIEVTKFMNIFFFLLNKKKKKGQIEI